MRVPSRSCLLAVGLVALLAIGCDSTGQEGKAVGNGVFNFFGAQRVTVPTGTLLEVRLDQALSSKTANRGDRWRGVVTSAVVVGDREVVPSGAVVDGTVLSVEEARRGSRARLELVVQSIQIKDRRTPMRARSKVIVAGSPRARNLGAIAGGAAAGALIGEATSDKPGTGAVIGGALAAGAVAASKGYQVVLRKGAVITFVVSEDVAVRVG